MDDTKMCAAIRSQNVVTCSYKGHDRVIHPHLLGISKTMKKKLLSVYQVGGSSESDNCVGWKCFEPELINEWTITNQSFSETAKGYNRDDSRMSSILCRI